MSTVSDYDEHHYDEEKEQVVSFVAKLKFFIITSVGFFSDGWLNGGFSYIVTMVGYTYWNGGSIPSLSQSLIKSGLSIGMIAGMVVFGFFGDALGRHKVYGKELIFTLLGTFMIVLTPWNNFSEQAVISWMTVWRVVTGFGIGGDYPMSASLNSETKLGMSRAKLITTSFFIYQMGTLLFTIFFLIVIVGYKNKIEENLYNVTYVWRLLFGLGMIPGFASLYERLTMKETKPYEKYVSKVTGLTGENVRTQKEGWADFVEYFNFKTAIARRHVITLVSTALTWFFFDIAFYGFSLNNSNILALIGYGSGNTKYQSLYNTAVGAIIITIFGIVGNLIGIFLPDIIGRRPQLIGGCLICAVLYAIWAGVENHTSTGGLMALFVISSLFLQGGPNNMTFLCPIEVFPTRVRGTAHGISAAVGKCGALLTAFAFGYLSTNAGLAAAIGLCSGVMVLATITSFGIPEVMGLTLDDIENDVQYLPRSERLAHIAARIDRRTAFASAPAPVEEKEAI
ncbi:Inorganic phosphate transporter pho84 [Saitozyma podzolica]|uniref:Inorganic phosphate transporter pho84 n=1 Tax=Saitozyma podzolica TaxID=1890683 RepID=A0A427Y2I6_9TREE|nr:Inorganic phosphate transporter pho84 [Saitozyma podzolica]